MKIVNVHRAKTHLSKLIERASHGEEIIIGRAGKPVAKLTGYSLETQPRKPGFWKGKIVISKGFDKLPSHLLKLFHSETP